ncbi:MAG TPA: hypothetical protein DCQ50_04295 [Chryseobacterium sp.]|nr:hypothetical protein [Chryseobacterium sp.]
MKNGNWVILKQSAYSGGTVEKFEFEDEEWYKELKKKVKPLDNKLYNLSRTVINQLAAIRIT